MQPCIKSKGFVPNLLPCHFKTIIPLTIPTMQHSSSAPLGWMSLAGMLFYCTDSLLRVFTDCHNTSKLDVHVLHNSRTVLASEHVINLFISINKLSFKSYCCLYIT